MVCRKRLSEINLDDLTFVIFIARNMAERNTKVRKPNSGVKVRCPTPILKN